MAITPQRIKEFEHYLYLEEKEHGTIDTYMVAVRQFAQFCGRQRLTKELVLRYKTELVHRYAPATVNTKIGPINLFLQHMGCGECRIKRLRIQRQMYYPQERELYYEEYVRLVETAQHRGDEQMSLLLQTVCATGIRVSELRYITVENVRQCRAAVYNKGKSRVILIPRELCRRLLLYAQRQRITRGVLFRSDDGQPLPRTLIWRKMHDMAEDAQVEPQKLHPHALRHLFAVTHYRQNRDPMGLADLLGHASLDTTRIYTATDGTEQLRQLENMNLLV